MSLEKITNILLTKESMVTYIYELRKAEAAKYGLTYEEYAKAIVEGTVVTPTIDDLKNAKNDNLLPLA